MTDQKTHSEDLVESIMSRHVHCADAGDDLLSAVRTMFSRRYSCAVVTRDGLVCGIITERDIVRLAATHANTLGQMNVADGMTSSVVTIPPYTTVADVSQLMKRNRCRRFPVVGDDGRLLGLITQSDIVGATNRTLGQYTNRLEREVETRTRCLQVANEELARLSLTDPLTGLHNRRSLFEHIERQIGHLQRHGGHMACVMVDIDRFKQVNDSYGHACGDQVLVRLAHMIRREVRTSDLTARYGGEEFVIVMDSDEENAVDVAERIRERAADVRFRHDGLEFGVTLSAGVAGRSFPTVISDADQLLAHSDAAMYEAKRSGRNRIVRASHLAVAGVV